MKRSDINSIFLEAKDCFQRHCWALPESPMWDITDFGLNDFANYGLVLINLAEEPEYCEKLMYARKGQRTPAHTHAQKKEDIICRSGVLALELWAGHPEKTTRGELFDLKISGQTRKFPSGDILRLKAGERVTLLPGCYHEFWPEAEDTIIGEVSTANDDANDNFFTNPDIGRFPGIEEDAEPLVRLLSEPAAK